MKDRVTSGFIAGVLAGIPMNIIDWGGYLLMIQEERLLDWASVAIFGHLALNIYETVFAQIGQLFFSGILGMIFSSLLLKLTSENHLIKGWFFGLTAWFGLYALSIALKLPTLMTHTFHAAMAHFVSASVYGLALAYILNVLDRKQIKI